MIKFTSYALTFAEVPDEISLCINISNCPRRCPNCHSPLLQEDVGEDLAQKLPALLDKFGGDITCVCFMGEGNDLAALAECLQYAASRGFHTCLYTGSEHPRDFPLEHLNYIKIGPYIEARGGLDKRTTNQRMLRVLQGGAVPALVDITHRFWPQENI